MSEVLKVFTTFSGYDSQCLALKYAGINYDLVGWSEIDKTAIDAHNALFPEYADRNFGDITKIDWNNTPDFDFLTYSSPCQDISIAGYHQGIEKGSGTRSSLLWEIEKAIIAKKPKYLMMENVKALVGKQFINDFMKWLDILDEMGYKSTYQVMNGVDCGIPQNRERVFVVSIRKDLAQDFEFPEPKDLTMTLSALFEDDVDEQYYVREEVRERVINKVVDSKK